MASSIPPSNPFDGFDSYSTVATPTKMTASPQGGAGTSTHQPQQYAVPPEYQRPVASVALPQFAEQMLPRAGSGFRPPPQQQMQMQQPVQQQPVQQQQQPAPVQQQQQLVPAAPSAMSPWALPPAAAAAPSSSAGQLAAANPFSAPPPQQQQQNQQVIQMDPFAVQMPMQQQQPQQHQLVPVQQPQYQQQPLLSPQYQIPPPQPMISPQQQQQQQQMSTPQQRLQNEVQGFFNDTPQTNNSTYSSVALMDEADEEGLGLIDVELDDDEKDTSNNNNTNSNNHERRKADGEYYGRNHHQPSTSTSTSSSLPQYDKNADIAPPPPITPARPHAEYLAKQTSSSRTGSSATSPLPKPNLVVHSGYVLSRISFRTVLMRKWKQTFWIQYGPTQLLFFRTFSDYEDWLNNPYHTQKARDFLVKLRVDFVSDLKKTSVMGYQVTQIRRKPYGKNVMLHFKLERWMDYGPTIAAAFAAREEEMVHSPSMNSRNNGRRNGNGGGGGGGEEYMNITNDVASLRKIILGCMRNARDAALVARRGPFSGEVGEQGEEDVYRGRYSTDRDDYANENGSASNNHRRGGSSGSSAVANMGYHQAFSAESSARRRMDDMEKKNDSSPDSAAVESVKTEESAEVPPQVATNGVLDLLG
mmetsp:Transcript_12994/g.18621  ORF Transcript_12994/g.18621 Transcript_12994/m.18621 type:complete len:642 (-) Transcript_12994:116-2041(-)